MASGLASAKQRKRDAVRIFGAWRMRSGPTRAGARWRICPRPTSTPYAGSGESDYPPPLFPNPPARRHDFWGRHGFWNGSGSIVVMF